MQRHRGELVPIGDALSELDVPVAAIPVASPQARRGFTVADQVDRLVWASEAAPDRGFMAPPKPPYRAKINCTGQSRRTRLPTARGS